MTVLCEYVHCKLLDEGYHMDVSDRPVARSNLACLIPRFFFCIPGLFFEALWGEKRRLPGMKVREREKERKRGEGDLLAIMHQSWSTSSPLLSEIENLVAMYEAS